MELGACPTITEPKVVAPEVDARVLLLESQTGLHLPSDKCEALADHTLDSVNKYFFENAVREESVSGWKEFRIQLKARPAPPTQADIELRRDYLRDAIRTVRTRQENYFNVLKRMRKAHGTDNSFPLINLQPCINAGYVIKEMSEDKMVLITPQIILQHLGNKYKMGRYRVTVEPGKIRVTQASGGLRVGAYGYQHPHVYSDTSPSATGDVCWGTAHTPYVDFIEKGDPTEALLQLLSVLRSYNPESPYRAISHWNTAMIGLKIPPELANAIPWDCHEVDDEDERELWANTEDYDDTEDYERNFYVVEYRDKDNNSKYLGKWALKRDKNNELYMACWHKPEPEIVQPSPAAVDLNGLNPV